MPELIRNHRGGRKQPPQWMTSPCRNAPARPSLALRERPILLDSSALFASSRSHSLNRKLRIGMWARGSFFPPFGSTGPAAPPFRGPVSRSCMVCFRLGPQLCSPPSGSVVTRRSSTGLSELRSVGGISPDGWSLLRGSPAITAAGLSPASPTQRARRSTNLPREARNRFASGRTIGGILGAGEGWSPGGVRARRQGPWRGVSYPRQGPPRVALRRKVARTVLSGN